jgi:hypothetical protein
MPRITAPVSFYGLSVYRVFYMHTICVFIFLALLARPLGVVAAPTTNLANGCVDKFDRNVDYFPEKIKGRKAQGGVRVQRRLFGISFAADPRPDRHT